MDTRTPGRHARAAALYVVHYSQGARQDGVCRARNTACKVKAADPVFLKVAPFPSNPPIPHVRNFRAELQLARHVGARRETTDARTMGVCDQCNLRIGSPSALEVSMGVYSLRRVAIPMVDTRTPSRPARGAALCVVHYSMGRNKMVCAAPGVRPYKAKVGDTVFLKSFAIFPEPREF